MDKEFPRNIVEFMDKFSTEEACRTYILRVRWPVNFVCPACGGGKGWNTARGTVYCSLCHRQTSPTAGTILHNSRVLLKRWFLAMWLACTQKTGLSASNLQRELGLGSYKTAWLMLQKLRQAMVRTGRERLSGIIEVDETYIGGNEEDVRGRKLVGKSLVAIAVEVNGQNLGRVRLRHIPDASGMSLVNFVTDYIEKGSIVHTDGWKGYRELGNREFQHRVTHTAGDEKLAVNIFPHVHLVASLLKRWLGATHQGRVGQKHLQQYLDEFTFRFNRRKSRYIGKIFYRLVEQLVLHQTLTYREIISRPTAN